MTELTRLTIAEARGKLRAREITSTELTEAYLGAIDAAVDVNAEREAGSNLDARHLQGLQSMTLRWMAMSLPPTTTRHFVMKSTAAFVCPSAVAFSASFCAVKLILPTGE